MERNLIEGQSVVVLTSALHLRPGSLNAMEYLRSGARSTGEEAKADLETFAQES